jgi:hypothetical protein
MGRVMKWVMDGTPVADSVAFEFLRNCLCLNTFDTYEAIGLLFCLAPTAFSDSAVFTDSFVMA